MDSKPIWQSKTLIGVLIAALPSLAKAFGYEISDVASFTAGASEAVDGIIALVGSALAVYGRITATAKLVAKK